MDHYFVIYILLDPLLGRWRLRVRVPGLDTLQQAVNIVGCAQLLEEGYELKELAVLHVVEPGHDRHSVLWMEDVGSGGVVHNYYFV